MHEKTVNPASEEVGMMFARLKRCTLQILLLCIGVTMVTIIITGGQLYTSDHHYIYGLNTTLPKTNVKLNKTNVSNVIRRAQLLHTTTKHLNEKDDETFALYIDTSFQNVTSVEKKSSPYQTETVNNNNSKPDTSTVNASIDFEGNLINFDEIFETANRTENNPNIVIILAYMHTGSSYTASVIKNHPGTFYEFEPLRSIQYSSRTKHWIQFLNGTVRRLVERDVGTDVGAEAVNNMVTCNHDKLDIETLSTYYTNNGIRGDKADFFKCLWLFKEFEFKTGQTNNNNTNSEWDHKKFRWNHKATMFRKPYHPQPNSDIGHRPYHPQPNSDIGHRPYHPQPNSHMGHQPYMPQRLGRRAHYYPRQSFKFHTQHLSEMKKSINSCLPKLISKCKMADIRLTKFIRMTMEMAEEILAKHTNVRVIHLLRDPRAMMDSQLRKNDMNVRIPRYFKSRTDYMCSRMLRDLSVSAELQTSYPGRIFTLRYEELVDDPLKTGQRVFDFIGVPFTSKDKQFIISTSIEIEKNATFRANKWRDHIEQEHLQIVDQYCQELYKKIGYTRFNSVDDVRQLHLPDHLKNVPVNI